MAMSLCRSCKRSLRRITAFLPLRFGIMVVGHGPSRLIGGDLNRRAVGSWCRGVLSCVYAGLLAGIVLRRFLGWTIVSLIEVVVLRIFLHLVFCMRIQAMVLRNAKVAQLTSGAPELLGSPRIEANDTNETPMVSSRDPGNVAQCGGRQGVYRRRRGSECGGKKVVVARHGREGEVITMHVRRGCQVGVDAWSAASFATERRLVSVHRSILSG